MFAAAINTKFPKDLVSFAAVIVAANYYVNFKIKLKKKLFTSLPWQLPSLIEKRVL